ncbi:MAG: tyrosine-type recombinase/integrase [Bacillota bacterium]
MKKRAAGEGSIIKRKDGRWMASALIGWDVKKNRPKRVYFYGDTQTEVKEKLQKAIHQHKEGGYIAPSKVFYGEWLDTWYNVYARAKLRPTTWLNYGYWIEKHIKPAIGGHLFFKLETKHIQQLYNEKAGILSPRSVRMLHTIINSSIEQAIKEGKLVRNPAKAAILPAKEKKEAVYMTERQIRDFLGSIKGDRWFPAFMLAVGTGIRLGELCALRWESVDLEKGSVRIKESTGLAKNEGGKRKTKRVILPPKTARGLRTVPVPGEVLGVLKKWKARQSAEKLQLGKAYRDQGYVFAWEDGHMLAPGSLSKYFRELMDAKGLREFHFHTLRHSFASMLIKKGESIKVIQELLGHSTITTAIDTYSHVEPEIKNKAAEKINELFK